MDVLLVEDNIELANLLKAFLAKKGFCLWHVESGEAAQTILQEKQFSLLLLDIELPQMDGFALCQFIRKSNPIPILIISARSNKKDQLMGFELGADDYLEKPVDPDILCAKMKALLQRNQSNNEKTNTYVSGSITIDALAHKVFVGNIQIELNTKEYELLLLFVENEGKTLSKEYLFNSIWGLDSESEYQTLTVHIKMLRKKIEEDERNPQRIQTVWGVGYRYEAV